jgi:hypothetical protein
LNNRRFPESANQNRIPDRADGFRDHNRRYCELARSRLSRWRRRRNP